MRLAIVTPYPPEISGVGQYGWNMAHWLAGAAALDTIAVIAPKSRGSPAEETDGKVCVRRAWSRDDSRAAFHILRAVRRFGADVAWFNLGLTVFGVAKPANLMGFAAPALTRSFGIPSAVTLHEIIQGAQLAEIGLKNGRLTGWGGRAAIRMLLNADVVCLTLNGYVDRIEREYGARNLVHLPHGAFSPPELVPPPNEPGGVLAFATFAPYKGLPCLLEAFRELRAGDAGIRLTIAGVDHPRFPGYLERIRGEAGEMDGVRWLGRVEEPAVREVFGAASIVVVPATATTGASSVVHRAAALGRPIVASDLPDLRRLADEEGLWLAFVPPADARALARTLRSLLADESLRLAMARRNLEAMRSMTIDHTGGRYLSIFRALADGRAGR